MGPVCRTTVLSHSAAVSGEPANGGFDEGFSMRAIDHGRFSKREFVSAGASIFLNGLALRDGVVTYNGSVGLNPLMGSFRYIEDF